MKVYQVPNLFTRMSPNTSVTEDSTNTFLIMFHEKNMRKRMYAKTATQKMRIKKVKEIKKTQDPTFGRVLEDLVAARASKMRRFCNYFVTLYHIDRINPFSQFTPTNKLKDLKDKVRMKMEYYSKTGSLNFENEIKSPSKVHIPSESVQKKKITDLDLRQT